MDKIYWDEAKCRRDTLAAAPNIHFNEKVTVLPSNLHAVAFEGNDTRTFRFHQIKLLPLAHSCGGFCLPPVPASHDCLSGQDVHSLSCVKSCRSVYVPAGQAWIVSLGSEDPAGQ